MRWRRNAPFIILRCHPVSYDILHSRAFRFLFWLHIHSACFKQHRRIFVDSIEKLDLFISRSTCIWIVENRPFVHNKLSSTVFCKQQSIAIARHQLWLSQNRYSKIRNKLERSTFTFCLWANKSCVLVSYTHTYTKTRSQKTEHTPSTCSV